MAFLKKVRRYRLLVFGLELVAATCFLVAWQLFGDGEGPLLGFYMSCAFGGWALVLRARAASEARFLRNAHRVPALILAIENMAPGRALRAGRFEVEYRYWPVADEPHESRVTLNCDQVSRLSSGQTTSAFVDENGQTTLASAIIYHRSGLEEAAGQLP